ncbi:MAG: hypothetical protein MJ223_03350 [Mycoplasmoidaceae bacterium]|nr:hypothetical protein [Mycoplasmoidaceae bacterium]
MLAETTKEVDSLFHAINSAKTYAIANGAYNKKAQPMSKEFAAALAEDLNLPNAITVLNNEVKQLNIAVRAKDFNKVNNLLNVIDAELDVLGLKNDKVDHQALTAKIKE